MPRPLPFNIVAAFSEGPFAGNPAAVVFVDDDLETTTLGKIAANFSQPITSVVGRRIPSADEKIAAFGVRWFTPSMEEVPMCGHGTMAAARAIFERQLVSGTVEVIEFHTATAGIMRARKFGKDQIEIRLPSTIVEDVSPVEREKITAVIADACGDMAVKYVGKGGKGFENYLMVELDEEKSLEKCQVKGEALLRTGYLVNVLTTASKGDELFVSRMFAPSALSPPEDPVCGSAHCLTGPYWFKKKNLEANAEFKARMVSARGGNLDLFWDQTAGVMVLRGKCYMMASGEIYL